MLTMQEKYNTNEYLKQIYKLSNKKKYAKWYFNIVFSGLCKFSENSKKLKKQSALKRYSYVEWHHIVPRCICKTKDDENAIENGVYLTAKQHFVCHWLLSKMFDDVGLTAKMQKAFSSFLRDCNGNRVINGNEYDSLKRASSKSASYFRTNHTGWSQSEEMKNKASQTHKKRYKENPNLREEHSIRAKNQMSSDEQRELRKIAQSRAWGGYTEKDRLDRILNSRYKKLLKNWNYYIIPKNFYELVDIVKSLKLITPKIIDMANILNLSRCTIRSILKFNG